MDRPIDVVLGSARSLLRTPPSHASELQTADMVCLIRELLAIIEDYAQPLRQTTQAGKLASVLYPEQQIETTLHAFCGEVDNPPPAGWRLTVRVAGKDAVKARVLCNEYGTRRAVCAAALLELQTQLDTQCRLLSERVADMKTWLRSTEPLLVEPVASSTSDAGNNEQSTETEGDHDDDV